MSTMTVRDAGRAAAHSSWVERRAPGPRRQGRGATRSSACWRCRSRIGQGGKAADRQGVLRHLATESWGEAALIALVVGFAAYALWRFADVLADRRNEGSDPKGLRQAGPLVRHRRRLHRLGGDRLLAAPSGAGEHRGGNEQQETA